MKKLDLDTNTGIEDRGLLKPSSGEGRGAMVPILEPIDLPSIILSLYTPITESWDKDSELITASELIESLIPLCQASNEFIFITMNDIGFMSKNIEGTLCWFVRPNN